MKTKVLVVDDEQDILDLVRYHLEREGYQVVGCRDGKAALDLVSWERPDLVILDLLMPRVDGLEVCRRLRQDSEDVADVVEGIALKRRVMGF